MRRLAGGDMVRRDIDRRSFIIGTGLSALAGRAALAQETYPAHAITFVNPFPPGGVADVIARPLAAALEPIVRQAVVVGTKAGAAGPAGPPVPRAASPARSPP